MFEILWKTSEVGWSAQWRSFEHLTPPISDRRGVPFPSEKTNRFPTWKVIASILGCVNFATSVRKYRSNSCAITPVGYNSTDMSYVIFMQALCTKIVNGVGGNMNVACPRGPKCVKATQIPRVPWVRCALNICNVFLQCVIALCRAYVSCMHDAGRVQPLVSTVSTWHPPSHPPRLIHSRTTEHVIDIFWKKIVSLFALPHVEFYLPKIIALSKWQRYWFSKEKEKCKLTCAPKAHYSYRWAL